jgi:hypothetical protein
MQQQAPGCHHVAMMLMSVLLASALSTSQGTGSLAGCIKDSTGQALRGA